MPEMLHERNVLLNRYSHLLNSHAQKVHKIWYDSLCLVMKAQDSPGSLVYINTILLSFFSRLGPNRPELGSRDQPQHFGGPPPLISPKPQPHPVPTSLWNPVSLIDNTTEARRLQESHPLPAHVSPYESTRQAIPLVKVERVYCPEKVEDGARKKEHLDKYLPGRETGGSEPGGFPHGPLLSEWEKPLQQRTPLPQSGPFVETLKNQTGSPYRHLLPRGHDPMYVYDEFLLQQRKLVSKLDLEERKRREAQEKGWCPSTLLRVSCFRGELRNG